MAARTAKQILRKEIKLRVALLSDEEKLRQSQVVTNKLLQMPQWQTSQRVSIFLHMSDEIRTNMILKQALESNKRCFIPRYVGSTMDMLHLKSLDDFASLPETAWKIKQPADEDQSRENALESEGLDVILMPGLGFSKSGDRLGRGKGFYDSYIEKYESAFGRKPCMIAVSFYEQICDSIPTTEHDVPVDIVLFEDKSS